MYDKIEKLLNSQIQHGNSSNRIYLMKLAKNDGPNIIAALDDLAKEKGYTKIFSKVAAADAELFLQAGHKAEGTIPGFFSGSEDAFFMGKYLDDSRAVPENAQQLEQILALAREKAQQGRAKAPKPSHNGDLIMDICTPDDAEEMAMVYKQVFPTYPFAIDDPEYIRQTMASHIVYYAARYAGNIVALSSSEMDEAAGNVEMTDFATLPHWRGNGLGLSLLSMMEEDMAKRGIKTAYTIARAVSPGMNITFAKAGYAFGGTLVNNTNISGRIESMNIWYKSLAG